MTIHTSAVIMPKGAADQIKTKGSLGVSSSFESKRIYQRDSLPKNMHLIDWECSLSWYHAHCPMGPLLRNGSIVPYYHDRSCWRLDDTYWLPQKERWGRGRRGGGGKEKEGEEEKNERGRGKWCGEVGDEIVAVDDEEMKEEEEEEEEDEEEARRN